MSTPTYVVVGPYAPHPGRAHLVPFAPGQDIVSGTATHPVRALCGLVVTSVHQERVGTRSGWGVNLWGRKADYQQACRRCAASAR